MADHHPCGGPQHGKVIGDRLGVGGADADVHQRYALPVFRHQVPGRHLVLAPAAVALRRLGRRVRGIQHHPARTGKAGEAAVGRLQLSAGPAQKFIHITVIVGEQDIGLRVMGRRAGIMLKPRQREIDARRIEQRQRARLVFGLRPDAVGQLVADMAQFRGGEVPRQRARRRSVERQVGRAVQHIGEGDFDVGGPHREAHAEIGHQQRHLLRQIAAEPVGMGDGDGIAARLHQPAIGARQAGIALRPVPLHGDFGINEQPRSAFGGSGRVPRFHIIAKGGAKVGDRAGMDFSELVDDGMGLLQGPHLLVLHVHRAAYAIEI